MFSIYEQVHLYISICLITGWGSKGAATARLPPYMEGDAYIHKGHVHIYMYT